MKKIELKEILAEAWGIVLSDWFYLAGVSATLAAMLLVLRTIFSFIFEYLPDNSIAGMVIGVSYLIVQLVFLIYCLESILLASIYAIEKKRVSVFETLSHALGKFKVFSVTLMLFLGTSVISLVLFIYPFFLYFPTAYLSLVISLREKREPYQALLRSRRLTKPYYAPSALVALLAIAILVLLEVPVLGWLVGVFFGLPFIANVFVLMYDELKKHYSYE